MSFIAGGNGASVAQVTAIVAAAVAPLATSAGVTAATAPLATTAQLATNVQTIKSIQNVVFTLNMTGASTALQSQGQAIAAVNLAKSVIIYRGYVNSGTTVNLPVYVNLNSNVLAAAYCNDAVGGPVTTLTIFATVVEYL